MLLFPCCILTIFVKGLRFWDSILHPWEDLLCDCFHLCNTSHFHLFMQIYHGVVSAGKGPGGKVPGRLPVELLDIDQQAHQLEVGMERPPDGRGVQGIPGRLLAVLGLEDRGRRGGCGHYTLPLCRLPTMIPLIYSEHCRARYAHKATCRGKRRMLTIALS